MTLNRNTIKSACSVALVALVTTTWAAKPIPYDKPETAAFLDKLNADIKAGKLVSVSAVGLAKAYGSNEVAADAKYKGKYLWVSGTVDSVTKSLGGAIIVGLRSNNQFLPLDAELDKSVGVVEGMEDTRSKVVKMSVVPPTEAATPLKKGQKIHLICKGAGTVMAAPQLKLCDTLSR